MTTEPAPDDSCDCAEFRAASSRRGFLRGALALGGVAAVTTVHGGAFTETSYAATGSAARVLVVLSMRGAADGMSLVVPHGDPNYYAARPRIGVPKDRLLATDAMFGLHPALKPLLPLWTAGKMAAVHATGQQVSTRSHFAAMESIEDADPGSSERSGWLNRLVARDGIGSPLEAVQLSGGVQATQLVGRHPVVTTEPSAMMEVAGPKNSAGRKGRVSSLNTTWGAAGGPLGRAGRSALQVSRQFAPVRATSARPANGAVYPAGDLGDALRAAARTIRADVGAEVITVDQGAWDHHNWLGTPDSGAMRRCADQFAAAVAAFFTDLGAVGSKVTLVTLSEFGRRVRENANWGLDHGHGNVMFAFGAGVKGGRYYGSWPGVQNTYEADLAVTTDYRSVLNEVTVARFGASPATVFPGLQPETIGFMTSL